MGPKILQLAALVATITHGSPGFPQGLPPAATTPSSGATCGNRLIEPGEDCTTCPQDCDIADCKVIDQRRKATVHIASVLGTNPSGVALRVAYKSDRLHLPGSGLEPTVRSRVTAEKPSTQVFANDMEHSLRIVLTDAQGLGGSRVEILFDRCDKAPKPHDDIVCWIERCAGSGGPISGCTCTVDAD